MHLKLGLRPIIDPPEAPTEGKAAAVKVGTHIEAFSHSISD